MVLFLIRVLITDTSVKGTSNEGFTQHNVVIHQLALTKIAQLGSSVAALTQPCLLTNILCWLFELSSVFSELLCIVQHRFLSHGKPPYITVAFVSIITSVG